MNENVPLDLTKRPSINSRRPIATPSDCAGDLDKSLKQETHNVAMALGDKNANLLDFEDDKGQIQQVSGGFGDSMTMDDETCKIL